LRRLLLVLSVMTAMAAMVVAMAVPAFADPGGVPGHCKEVAGPLFLERCSGGSGAQGGGGGGQTTTTVFAPVTITTGGSGGQGGGGGGRNCVNFLDKPIVCQHGNRAG
jgi:hypothetical protein